VLKYFDIIFSGLQHLLNISCDYAAEHDIVLIAKRQSV